MLKVLPFIALLLAGCVTQPSGPTLDPDRNFRVAEVQVEAAEAAAAEQRGFNLTEAEAEALLRAPIQEVLSDVNPDGATPVIVAVTIRRLFIPNVASAAVGRSASRAEGAAQIFDASTGAALGAPFPITGLGEFRAGGSFGAVLTAGSLVTNGEAGEITLAGAGLARALSIMIYGIDPN